MTPSPPTFRDGWVRTCNERCATVGTPGEYAIYSTRVYLKTPIMPHTAEEKKRVLTRVRRLRGQIDALERVLEEGAECGPVLQQIAAVRGAVNGLMSGVLESHLREEFMQWGTASESQQASIDEVVSLVRSYLR